MKNGHNFFDQISKMAAMAAVLKIYFKRLLNWKASWLETCQEVLGWFVNQKYLKSFQSEIQDGSYSELNLNQNAN